MGVNFRLRCSVEVIKKVLILRLMKSGNSPRPKDANSPADALSACLNDRSPIAGPLLADRLPVFTHFMVKYIVGLKIYAPLGGKIICATSEQLQRYPPACSNQRRRPDNLISDTVIAASKSERILS